MSRILTFLGQRRRYPLYTGLTAALAGCVLSAALSLLGSTEVQRQSDALFSGVRTLCAAAGDAPVCDAMRAADHLFEERVAVLLLLQGLCFALIVGGALFIGMRAHQVLVQRPRAALAATSEAARARGSDEIGRLVESLTELTARQAGFEAEGRWQQQVATERVRRKTQALSTIHRVARLFSEGDVSEFTLLSGLTLLETAMGAQNAALCLAAGVQKALGTAPVVSTRGEPQLAGTIPLETQGLETSLRLVPPGPGRTLQTLVVPLSRGAVCVGTLLAEFAPGFRIDDAQIQLAETFSNLSALAISSVSRSQEERRVALMEERGAIAAELHDSLAQSLAFMKIQVARLQGGLDVGEQPAEVIQAARELREGLSAAYGEVRELIAAFRVRMGPGGLVRAVEDAIEEFSQRSGLEIGFDAQLGRCHLEVNEEFHVLQVIREALSNAVRHARAQHVWVVARYGADHRFVVTVDDDGRGPGGAQPGSGHYGLSIMQERARSLNGELSMAQRPEGGTQVRLWFSPLRIPLETPDAEATP